MFDGTKETRQRPPIQTGAQVFDIVKDISMIGGKTKGGRERERKKEKKKGRQEEKRKSNVEEGVYFL